MDLIEENGQRLIACSHFNHTFHRPVSLSQRAACKHSALCRFHAASSFRAGAPVTKLSSAGAGAAEAEGRARSRDAAGAVADRRRRGQEISRRRTMAQCRRWSACVPPGSGRTAFRPRESLSTAQGRVRRQQRGIPSSGGYPAAEIPSSAGPYSRGYPAAKDTQQRRRL